QRHDWAQDDPLEIGAWALVGRAHSQGRKRLDVRAAGCAGAPGRRGGSPAHRGPPARNSLTAFLNEPVAQDRCIVADAFPDGFDHPRQVDHPAPADGDPRCGKRRDLGPARPAVPGSGRSRAAQAQRRDPRRRREAVTDTAAVAGGGFIDMPNQRIAVRHLAAIDEPEDLARTTVAFRNGAPLRLGDIAQVKIGYPPPIGGAVINDGEGLLLIVEKQPTGNTLAVTREVEKALEDLKPGLKGVEIDPTIFRPATFIERSLKNLSDAMVVGCVLVTVILLLFLFDWRTAVISLTAIPLSLLAATLVLTAMGATLNTMVIAGLVI